MQGWRASLLRAACACALCAQAVAARARLEPDVVDAEAVPELHLPQQLLPLVRSPPHRASTTPPPPAAARGVEDVAAARTGGGGGFSITVYGACLSVMYEIEFFSQG